MPFRILIIQIGECGDTYLKDQNKSKPLSNAIMHYRIGLFYYRARQRNGYPLFVEMIWILMII